MEGLSITQEKVQLMDLSVLFSGAAVGGDPGEGEASGGGAQQDSAVQGVGGPAHSYCKVVQERLRNKRIHYPGIFLNVKLENLNFLFE